MIGLAVLTDRWNSDTRSRACMGWCNQIATLSNAYNFRFDWYVYVVINLSMSVVAAFAAAACVVRFTWWIHEVCTCCGIWSECRVRLDLFIAVVKLCVRWRLWLSYVPVRCCLTATVCVSAGARCPAARSAARRVDRPPPVTDPRPFTDPHSAVPTRLIDCFSTRHHHHHPTQSVSRT